MHHCAAHYSVTIQQLLRHFHVHVGILQDITQLTSNFEQLKVAQSKFQGSSATLASLASFTEAREILVPMTSSLYVPGTLVAGSQVLVDIGTNFIVGKSPADADEIFQKKIAGLKVSTDQLMKIINDKKGDLGKLEAMEEQIKAVIARSQPAPTS